MSELTIKYAGTQSLTMEYGSLMEATDSFMVLVPAAIHGGSVEIALAIVCNHPGLISAAQVQVQTAIKLKSGEYKVTGTRTRLNVARRQDNFRLVSRSSLTSSETAVDVNGIPIYVTFDGDTQITTMDKDVPTYDLTCVGIRDITPMGSFARLQAFWTGGVNSGIFDAFENAQIGAGGLICAGVDCDPHSVNDLENKYRIQFRFVGSRDGWRKYAYWKDEAPGRPPSDMTPANWSRLVQLYHEFDFQTAWPFGEDVGT